MLLYGLLCAICWTQSILLLESSTKEYGTVYEINKVRHDSLLYCAMGFFYIFSYSFCMPLESCKRIQQMKIACTAQLNTRPAISSTQNRHAYVSLHCPSHLSSHLTTGFAPDLWHVLFCLCSTWLAIIICAQPSACPWDGTLPETLCVLSVRASVQIV